MDSSERGISRPVVAVIGVVTVGAVVFRAMLEDQHGFGWEAARVVLDAVIDVGLAAIVAVLIIDRFSSLFTMRSMAKENWGGFRLLGITVADSLADLAVGFERQYGAFDSDWDMQQAVEETWQKVAGPPAEEGVKKLNLVALRVKFAEERYSKGMDQLKLAQPGDGEALVRKLENASEDPDHVQALLRTIDDAVWHLAELWPVGDLLVVRPVFLEKNLQLQQSGRRWRHLSMSKPYEISPEFDLAFHRRDIAGAALKLLKDAVSFYIYLVVLSKQIRKAGIKPGSDLDQLWEMRDETAKLLN
jgi:hypothetical protein